MNKKVELPLIDPLYNTYHYQGACTAIATTNPTIKNECLNERMNLFCTRKFLNGFTSPELSIAGTAWWESECLEKAEISSRFAGGYINHIIRKMLDDGYYVAFDNVDDFYVEGKSWYHKKHFAHDGLICGYDQDKKTYCIYAYDSSWRYQKFWTSQKSFNRGRTAMKKKGIYSYFYAIKPKSDIVEFSPKTAYDRLKEYMDSNTKKYSFSGEGTVFGIAVHAFIARYVAMLYQGDIPYERMDRRVFHVLWEHKKVMYDRIRLIEENLGFNHTISKKYEALLKEADTARMLYASYHMKRRDSLLPTIEEKTLKIMREERILINQLLRKMKRKFENGSVDILKKQNAETP